ncbi:DUF2278 family protein [Rhizobium calliandrae]|uniref:DUF2278 family protein n=1 Tax=Rhizobium calliandrae TaxID=1312182 RepID=A0ABT7KMK4_9HYPH|nr:DUF2278 family protein [Rhizobium calliandrae]MDL2408503.1 DUF2278 family protein [Rhizobium calliandrae]
MTIPYGYAKGTVISAPSLKPTRRDHETQYHLHFSVQVADEVWDVAVNVGTNDSDDLLKYKLVFDYRHPLIQTLQASPAGKNDLTDVNALPALDFVRSDLLGTTGRWRDSAVMDGSDTPEPVASLTRLIEKALSEKFDVYVFGRFYSEGNGIHDAHMNQGSKGRYIHRPNSDQNDHNAVWQDGAVLIDCRQPEWAAYFAAFEQQYLPTDDLGNPTPSSSPIS